MRQTVSLGFNPVNILILSVFLRQLIWFLMRNTSVTQMAEPSKNCQINAKQLNTSQSKNKH
jgi:hypothetical protein